jgi:hypothetical protein
MNHPLLQSLDAEEEEDVGEEPVPGEKRPAAAGKASQAWP